MDWTGIIQIIIEHAVELTITIIMAIASAYVIPWLKRKGLYDTVQRLVAAAKEYGRNEGWTGEQKLQMVLDELKALGVDTNNSYVNMLVSAAVTELRDATGKT